MAREYRTGVKITGDSSGGVRATKAARGELDKLSDAQRRHNTIADRARNTVVAGGRAITAFTATAGIAIGVVGGLAKRVADKGDRLQKLSIQLGTSTEFLSGMGHAAELSGASLETLEKGFGKMQKSIADGVAGLTTAVRGFDALGLKAEELQRLAPEDQFLTIADRLGQLDDKSKRVAVSMDLFGRSGRELIPLFEQGGAGIQAMRDEAERFGLVISTDLADASAQFNDDLTRLKGLSEGIRNQFAEGLLPQVTAVAQHFLEGAEASDAWKSAGEVLGNTVRVLVAGFIVLKEALGVTWDTAEFVFSSLVDLVAAAATPIIDSAERIGEAFLRMLAGDTVGAAALVKDIPRQMAENWTASLADIQARGAEFKTGMKDRVQKAVEDIHDVLTRTPQIAQGAGEALVEAGEDAAVLGKEAELAAKRLQSLLDRLDPLAAMARQFAADEAALTAEIEKGGDNVLELEAALILLRAEYARNRAEAEGYGDAAVEAGERAIAAVIKERKTRAEELAKSQRDVENFHTAFARGIERLDDLGADLWRGWFTGARNALESIKDFFLNWLAEMAHAALTRPILVSFTGAFLPGTAAAGGGIGLPGLGGGGGGILSQLAGLFTGNSIGQGFANLPSWLGGTSNTFAGGAGFNSAGGLFGNAGQFANWQYGLAGILGGIGGQALFGGQGGLGGGIGATAGLAIGGPIGAIIGGILGGFVGGLFGGRDPRTTIGGAGFPGASDPRHQRITTPFGELVSVHARGGVGGFLEAGTFGEVLGQSIQAFDQVIFDFVSAVAGEEQIDKIKGALENWGGTWADGALTVENILEDRWISILGTFTTEMQAFVRDAEGIEAQVERLNLGLIAEKIIAGAPDLFEGVTFQRFVEVAEQMQLAGEDLTTTFSRLVQAVDIVTSQLNFLKEFAETDLSQVFDQIIAEQGRSLQDVARGLVDQIVELRANFTGSAEDLQRLSLAAAEFGQVGLQFLALVDQVKAGIIASSQPFQEQIQRDLLGDEGFYNLITTRAKELALALRDMTDPAQIAATQAEILRLTQTAYNLLPADQRASQGQAFLDFIQGVEADALEQLTEARENFLDDSEFVRGLIDEMVDGFADPLTIVANAHQDAANDHMSAADQLYTAGDHLIAASRGLGSLPGIIASSLQGLALQAQGPGGFTPFGAPAPVFTFTPSAAPPPPSSSPPGGGGQPFKVSDATLRQVAEIVGSSIQVYGDRTVQAIRSSDRSIRLDMRGLTSSPRRGQRQSR